MLLMNMHERKRKLAVAQESLEAIDALKDLKERKNEQLKDFVASLDGPSFTKKCKATSSAWAKENKLSPDAVAQLAFQLGHSKLNGYPVATYEAAQTSFFKHGRTETIRSCTSASKEMCEIFLDSNSTKEARANALTNAAKYHGKLASEAQRGNGWDRHLFALRKLADSNESSIICNSSEDIPFFQDHAYKKLSNINDINNPLVKKLINFLNADKDRAILSPK